MGPCFKSYKSYKFDRPETIRDQAKMNLAGRCVWRLYGNYFEPWFSCSSWAIPDNIHTIPQTAFQNLRERVGGSTGNLKAWGYTYNWNSEGMGGLHVDLEFPRGTDKSVRAFL